MKLTLDLLQTPSVLSFSFDVIGFCVTRCVATSYTTFHSVICKRQNTSGILDDPAGNYHSLGFPYGGVILKVSPEGSTT